jgi:hypothetical protein
LKAGEEAVSGHLKVVGVGEDRRRQGGAEAV